MSDAAPRTLDRSTAPRDGRGRGGGEGHTRAQHVHARTDGRSIQSLWLLPAVPRRVRDALGRSLRDALGRSQPPSDLHLRAPLRRRRGNAFEEADAEWNKHNPADFKYGHGGKHMRTDSSSSQLSSAPHEAFLNRYSTSSIAEDKAEIWAALMCYQQVLKSPALRAKAQLLKQRAASICSAMDEPWWAQVIEHQSKLIDHWEVHYVDQQRGKAYWCNWVTEERRWTKPPEAASTA